MFNINLGLWLVVTSDMVAEMGGFIVCIARGGIWASLSYPARDPGNSSEMLMQATPTKLYLKRNSEK